MVDLSQILSDIVSQIEYDNIVLIGNGRCKASVDIDLLRHHPKLQDARIFRLIMGFSNGLWKKTNHTNERFAEIFEEYHFKPYHYCIFRELLVFGKILPDSTSFNYKLKMLIEISNTFGGIPYIDEYLLNLDKKEQETKRKKEEQSYNPQQPSDDYKNMYDWSYITLPSTNQLLWYNNHTPENGWSFTDILELNASTLVTARKLKT